MPPASPYAARLGRIPVERREVQVLGSSTAYWVYGPAGDQTRDDVTTIIAVHGFRG